MLACAGTAVICAMRFAGLGGGFDAYQWPQSAIWPNFSAPALCQARISAYDRQMSFSPLDSPLLGPLFTTAAMRSVFSDRARLKAMLACEAALARAQARLGLVPDGLAPAIAAIDVEAFDLAAMGQATALAGVPVIPFLKAVQMHLPQALEPALHKGATTQDIADTALVLQMRQAFALLRADLCEIIAALALLAQKHRATACVGRTYGQHAAPLTFGCKVAVWCAGIAEAAVQLDGLEHRVLAASLSGPVGTLAAMGDQGPALLQAFADELRLGTATIAWHSLRARMVEAGVWLATLMGALGKMAADVVFLAATEVGEVCEPHVAGRGGSSAMPHKRNPVGCTVVLAAASAAKGHVTTLLDAMLAGHERPAGAWHAEWHALPQLFGLAAGSLREAKVLAQGLVVDEARMLANIGLTRGLLFADAAAARLAGAMGRDAAHRCVEKAAGLVRDSGVFLLDALLADRDILRHGAGESLADAFDLSAAVNAATLWTDRATIEATRILRALSPQER